MAFHLVGYRYSRAFPKSTRESEIIGSRNRLLHQMGRGIIVSYDNKPEHRQVLLETDNMLLRDTTHTNFR